VFDFLINAEVVVDDVAVAERVFVDRLGFPEPRPWWKGTISSGGFSYLFARVHPSLEVSPTRVEAMALAPIDPGRAPFVPQLFAAQGERPWKTHGNEVASSDIGTVTARLERNGCAFFTMPSEETYPFTRLWLGWTADGPGEYQPDGDGGLMLEICETDSLLQGPTLWDPRPDPELPAGSMIRVLRRSWIVADLDATLRALDHNLDWHPRAEPVLDADGGCRRVAMAFAHPRSAELELLEPIAPGEVLESLDTWGPGAWKIRIGVNDLRAKADDLRHRGTTFSEHDPAGDDAVLLVDTADLGVPGLFEFTGI